MANDAADEQMAEDVYDAMKPLREWFNKAPLGQTEFEKAHEDAEILLMKLIDKYYGNGFKDGVTDEKYTREMTEGLCDD